MKRMATIVVVVVAGLAGPALAAWAVGPVEIGVGGGFSLPVNSLGDAFDNGFHVKGIVNFKPPSFPMALRGALGYQEFDATQLLPIEEGTSKMTSLLGGLSLNLLSLGPITPYVTASLGVYHFSTEITSAGDAVSDKQTTFGIDAGAGVKLNLIGFKAFVEGRIENAFTDEGLNPVLKNTDNMQAVPITFGVLF